LCEVFFFKSNGRRRKSSRNGDTVGTCWQESQKDLAHIRIFVQFQSARW